MAKRTSIRHSPIGSNGAAARPASDRGRPQKPALALSAVVEELETYREETRVQTQQLLQTQELLQKSRDRFADLFDFAPVPYLILDGWGLICDVNLTASTMLKIERSRVNRLPFLVYVKKTDRPVFLEHMRRCRSETGRVETELRLLTSKQELIPVQLTSRRSLEASEQGVVYPTTMIDLTERERATAARNSLLQRLMTALETERQRISRDLHDQLGQQITALMLGLRALEGATSDPQQAAQTRQLLQIADDLGRDAHRVALNLRPTALDDLGLYAALSSFIDDWSRRSRIAIEYNIHAQSEKRLPSDVETVLYRAVQEALSNIAKHAQARHVSVLVRAANSEANAVIEDDGCGFEGQFVFEAAIKSGRLGLVGLRERVQLLGGKLDIESAPGHGTTIFVRVPVNRKQE